MGRRRSINIKGFIVLSLSLFNLLLNGQDIFVPLGKDAYQYLRRMEIKQGLVDSVHLSQQPVINKTFILLSALDPLSNIEKDYFESEFHYLYGEAIGNSSKNYRDLIFKKKADFYTYKKQNSIIRLNPVIHFGYESESHMPELRFINSRGLEIKGSIDNKVGFYTYLTDNQVRAPFYVGQQIIAQQGSFPGGPWVKTFKEDQEILLQHDTIGVIDFFNVRGFINFRASEHINVQFGHDRHFIGHGLRSLVISDNAYNTFFLKLKTQLGRFSYQNIFMELNNWPELRLNNLIQKKYASIHHLSINVNSKLNLGFFESIFYARGDTSEYPSMELQYLNPIIFYRSIEHGLGSPDNANLGFDFKYKPLKNIEIYGQFVLDDLDFQYLKMDFDSLFVKYGLKKTRSYDKYQYWLNKWGVQFGVRYVDVLGIKNLDMQLEYNRVRPFTFAHGDQRQNVSHYYQALAHPLGANFSENLVQLNYRFKEKWRFLFEGFYASYGLDSIGSNYGKDIHKNPYFPGLDLYADGYFDVKVGQGIPTSWGLQRLTISYEWKHNLYIDFKLAHRRVKSQADNYNSNKWFYGLALRWNAIPFRHNF
jgi:hypothetical protein